MLRNIAACAAAIMLISTAALAGSVRHVEKVAVRPPVKAVQVAVNAEAVQNLDSHIDALTASLDEFSRYFKTAAPNTPGTGTGATVGTTTTGYPIGAVNGTDIWESNGPTTILSAPLIATTGASPQSQIAATTGKQIIVLAIDLTSSISLSTVQFQDEAGTPNKLSGVYTFPVDGPLILPFNPGGYIRTLTGAALDIATTGTSNVVGGTITYCLN